MENNGEQWSETEQSEGKSRLDVSSSFITDGNNYGSICPWEEAESFSWDSNETMQRRRALLKLEAGGAVGKGICWHVLGQRISCSPLPVNLVQIEDLIIGYFLLERLQHIVLLTFTRSNEGILIYYNLRLCLMFWWWWEECLEGADC